PCARNHAQLRMLLLDAADVVRLGAAGGMPDVTELLSPADCMLRAAPDPDLRQRRRVRLGRRIVERPVLAVEVLVAAPEGAHQPDRLVGAAASALERHAHEVVFVLVPAHPDAEMEAAAAELLQ